jgi:hypothetical protein
MRSRPFSTSLLTRTFAACALAGSTLAGCNDKPSNATPATTAEPEAPKREVSIPSGSSSASPGAGAQAADKPGSKTFGAPIGQGELTSLASLAAEPARFSGKTIKTEGTVTAVCQHMGCWMEIGTDDKLAHIKMAGHSFFVPKDASGHHAIVEGQVEDGGGSGGACMHEGKDSCAGDKSAKLQLVATGVELVD